MYDRLCRIHKEGDEAATECSLRAHPENRCGPASVGSVRACCCCTRFTPRAVLASCLQCNLLETGGAQNLDPDSVGYLVVFVDPAWIWIRPHPKF